MEPHADLDARLESWREELANPSTMLVAARGSAALARQLRRRGRADDAIAVCEGALALDQVRGADVILDLRHQRSMARLDQGVEPDDLGDVVASLLGRSDALWADALTDGSEPRARSAARRLYEALTLLTHRGLNTTTRTSPLAQDPDSSLASLRASELYRRLAEAAQVRTPRGRRRVGGPCHVVLLTHQRSFFSGPLARASEPVAGGVRPVLLSEVADPAPQGHLAERAVRLLRGERGATQMPAGFERATHCAYVVDWADEAAVWASVRLPPGPRLVVRLHSVEALSLWVHVIDWARVDHLVFVSDTLRRLTHAVVPAAASVPWSVIRHGVAAVPHGPKPEAARTTLGMVGWGQVVKDPLFALLTLREIRAAAPGKNWTLRLIGAPLEEGARPWEDQYHREVLALMESPELRGAVELVGHTDDVAAALEPVGFILSTSLRESDPHGLVEGVLSGAVPVVRDWPAVAPWGGARTLFPEEWVVTTPAEAAARVLAVGDPAAQAARAERWVLEEMSEQAEQRALRRVIWG